MPAAVTVDGTTGLRDGQDVRVRAAADNGSEIFGFEAFLCAGTAKVDTDADVRPSLTGNCASKPLSAGSDKYKEVRGAPPYQVVESTFRAGVGSDSYTTEDGVPVTISCGPESPCQLVLKVQFPNGYGFRAYPLAYA